MLRRLFLFAASAFGCYGFGQPNLAFQSGQRLVTLNVAATDAKGDPVTDLQAGDMQVREDGKVQPIVFFRFAGSKRTVAAPAPGQFINRPAPPAMFILLDRWNERIITAASGWNDVDTALQHQESVDRVFIYILTSRGDLFPVHSLPVTAADLRAASEPSPADLIAKLNDAVRKLNGLRNVDVRDPVVRVNTTWQALESLLNQMATIAGRKSLIWVTHGVPLTARTLTGDIMDITPQVRGLSAGAAQYHVAIYTVAQSEAGAGADVGSRTQETLQMVAALTGGRFYSSGGADRAIADAITDARGNYRVAYYSAIRDKGHKEHKIRVEATRKGVHLSTQDAYPGDIAPVDPDKKEEFAFGSACRSAFDATEIGLRVSPSTAPSGGAAQLDIAVDPGDVLIERRGESYQGSLDVMLASYSEGVLTGQSRPTHFDINLTQEQFNKAAQDWIHIPQTVPVSDGSRKIRVVVFDRGLQGLGSVTIPAK
jgi:VWFA-related protein